MTQTMTRWSLRPSPVTPCSVASGSGQTTTPVHALNALNIPVLLCLLNISFWKPRFVLRGAPSIPFCWSLLRIICRNGFYLCDVATQARRDKAMQRIIVNLAELSSSAGLPRSRPQRSSRSHHPGRREKTSRPATRRGW